MASSAFITSLKVAEDGLRKRDEARIECTRLHAEGSEALALGKETKSTADLFRSKRYFKVGLELAEKSADDAGEYQTVATKTNAMISAYHSRQI